MGLAWKRRCCGWYVVYVMAAADSLDEELTMGKCGDAALADLNPSVQAKTPSHDLAPSKPSQAESQRLP